MRRVSPAAPRGALRFVNPGAEPVEVFALADALIRPDFKDRGRTPGVTGQDARAALSIARAAIQSVTTGSPVRIDEVKDE